MREDTHVAMKREITLIGLLIMALKPFYLTSYMKCKQYGINQCECVFCFVLFVVGIYFYIASCVSKLSITADKEALLSSYATLVMLICTVMVHLN
jgi:cytochrome b subunit of formate dehydrogenase